MAFDPAVFDHNTFDVVQSQIYKYTSDNDYWQPLKCVVEIYDNTGNTLLLSYDSFNPQSNTTVLLECSVTLGLTNTQFTLRFEDGNGVIDQNTIGLGNKVLVYAGRVSNDLTLLFTGYSEDRTPIIFGNNVMDYTMTGHGENATLNDIIINFKRASSSLVDIEDPNFPKRPDAKMVAWELVKDIFEDSDVRVTKDIILKDYLKLNITGVSPLVTERLLSIVQSMREVSAVLNFLCEVTGAYWNIENGKLYFEYPEIKHSGITLKNKPERTDLASSTSYFIDQWRYTDSISKSNGFANRIYTTTAVDTKSVANAMTNKGATALFDRAIAQQVQLTETRLNTLTFILSKIGDPFVELPEDQELNRGGTPSNPPPPPPTCPQGYHLDTNTNQCVPDNPPTNPQCPSGYHWDTNIQQCVLNNPPGGGGEGGIDGYGIEWLIGNGEQFLIEQSRDEAIDDRWSGNVTGLRQGAEATMITKSIGVASDGHVAMKIGGGNHSGSGASDQRWYDIGWRANGELQLQWEGPHPSNHSFTLPDTKCFIRNLGFGLEGRWLGLKWCVQTVTPNSTPATGGVRVRHWIDRDPIGTDGKPKNNWELVLDFIDGVDVQVIDPQTYAMPDEWDCEVRKSDTNSHEVYQNGLHVRRLGTPNTDPNPPTDPVCPTGYHYNPATTHCEVDTLLPPIINSGINQTAALNFIKNSYNESVQMLEEAPGFSVYWLWNDQLLGHACLKHIDSSLATTVENKMNSYGVTMWTPWATLIPKYRNNYSIRHVTERTISTNPMVRYSDYNGSGNIGYDYADICFLSAIHNYYTGNLTEARTAYDAGRAMWDGQGMKDSGNITGEYAVYKVALGMLAERITGFLPKIGIPDNYFAPFQHANGGIITDKTGGVPSGSQNIETTAAVLFAINPTLLTRQMVFHIGGDFRNTQATGTNIVSNDPDLILTTGDYGIDTSANTWCNQTMSMWKNSGIPTYGVIGNHDGNEYLSQGFFQNTSWEWTHKQNGIAFIGCNTISENYQDADTRCAEAFNDPSIHTIIPIMHEGIWHPEGTSVSSDTVLDFHTTFLKYRPKLKMVVCGHTHVYGRMKPVDNILYVMNGIGGQSPSTGSTSPNPFHKINGILRCTLNTDNSIFCESIPNTGEAPQIMDTFTIKADGTVTAPLVGVNVRPRTQTIIPLSKLTPELRESTETNRPPRVSDPKKVVGKACKPFDCPRSVKHTMIQKPESVIYVDENNIIQSAPSSSTTNPEQIVEGEIRIDIDNKPIGPVISQFKVNVGGVTSTADTIFVNDIKVDASVLSPTAKYWIVLMPCGTSYRNTVLWHHDGDLVTKDRYSAFAKGRTRSTLSEFHVSNYGPTYTHAVFARLRRIQEYSDPQSIQKFRLKEDIAEADFLDDSVSVAKLMQNVLAIRGKPVRMYDINEVTLPLDKWFTPGQNITIVDDTGKHEEDKNIFAEIQEVTYSWNTGDSDSTLGIFRVRVLPVGHLNYHTEMFPSGD